MKKEFRPVRIAVVGTLCWDKITRPDRTTAEGFGGIAYTILTLASLLESRAEIMPVCQVGKERYQEARRLFKRNPEINLRGLKKVEQKNNTVTLVYQDPHNREEVLEGRVPSLRIQQIEPFLQVEYILINLISGWDIELGALQKIRAESEAKIYLDLHSLTLGIDEKGKRFSKKPANWKEYVGCADYLQLNRRELETILGQSLTLEEVNLGARELLDLGPQIVLATLGERGCYLTYQKGKEAISELITTKPVGPIKDTTGCGDVFGAGFLAKFITGGDPVPAADFANYVAGLKATFSGLEGLQYFTPLDLEFA